MSIVYCENCDRYIDLDFDSDHFDEPMDCEVNEKSNDRRYDSAKYEKKI